jgi:CspA family cold shock protein
MNYRDRWETDELGNKYLFTVEMQRRLGNKGLPADPEYVTELEPVGQRQSSESRRDERTAPEQKPKERVDFAEPETVQIDPQTGKYIGRMKWYNMRKGYGFIVRGGGEEIFFHKSGAAGNPEELQEGQWILYDVEETHKGPEATDVEPYQGDTDLLN